MIHRTGIRCRSCKMPVVLPTKNGLPSPPFCGCRFYRETAKNIIIDISPQMRMRIESLWLVRHNGGNGFALVGKDLEVLVENCKVRLMRLNGEPMPVRGARLILPPT